MSAITSDLRVLRDARAILVESLWWDPAGDVMWNDITAGTLHRSPWTGAVDGSDDTVLELPPPLASFQPADDGGYVAGLGDRIVLVDRDGRITRELARVRHAHGGIRMNEGKVDPAGRFVIGSMDVTDGEPDAAVYSIDGSGTLRTLLGGFAVTNGFEWTDDGRTMVLADTGQQAVYRAPYSADGELGELEHWIHGEMSDGLTLDVDGYAWNGIYGGGKVIRWAPDGTKDLEIEVPAPNVTSVAFAGPDLRTLVIGTARENLTEDQLEEHPLSGGVFAIDTAVSGRPVNVFRTVVDDAWRA
ncbi:SMP-30/gluconolactonase/LRE family protein [Clavibacter sp. VKM Ac-2873]|uniref:SMP-30/gluconolactonase/LRE family protein n=1 Tax=Clavibacter sp. VKM Ac-2873 TaxID=2783813 RepID=UPI00188CBDD6|nr:SMP-30/gluconolactonase/LRE family protein [Clavibacter sp. VKM Ac-2873]MBF4619001.1 SMP-30/gluconolactonase/LRE family protein [Clavibacter sp. VKM Ac-2873]